MRARVLVRSRVSVREAGEKEDLPSERFTTTRARRCYTTTTYASLDTAAMIALDDASS